MGKRFWTLWLIGNLAWLIVVPLLVGVWLQHEVRAEYLSGARTSTDGDSISVPVFGIAIVNFLLVAAINGALGVYALLRRKRAT
jgi:hypothetical protein